MIKDSKGNELKAGDVCFYTELPVDDYANSIVEIYEDNEGVLRVRTLVYNHYGEYKQLINDDSDKLALSDYQKDIFFNDTGICSELTLINEMKPENATVEYANKNYPLKQEDKTC